MKKLEKNFLVEDEELLGMEVDEEQNEEQPIDAEPFRDEIIDAMDIGSWMPWCVRNENELW